MKISLWIRHYGLAVLLRDLLSDHEIFTTPDEGNPLYPKLGFPPSDGSEDVRISTMPHHDLNTFDDDKPTIAYVTDPIYYSARPAFNRWMEKPNFHAIGAEECFPLSLVVPLEKLIPYAVTNYPKYNPSINKVLIVNRKPNERMKDVTLGVLKKPMDVAEVLGPDIPWHWGNEPDREKFKQMYADYKVLFYFSNSPYTIVLYEAMTVGMPIVAFNWTYAGWTQIMQRYLPNLTIDISEIRTMLWKELATTPPKQPIEYGIPRFSDIKREWNDLLRAIT